MHQADMAPMHAEEAASEAYLVRQPTTPRLDRLINCGGGDKPFSVAECRAALNAADGDVEQAESMLKSTRATSATSTELYSAAWHGNTESIRKLLARGADVNFPHPFGGSSPLYVACECGHTEAAKLLLSAGARVDQARDDGATPLYKACQDPENGEVAELLIASGAQVNQAVEEDGGMTPLWVACHQGAPAAVTALLDAGADPNVTVQGWTPLEMARSEAAAGSREGREEVLNILLTHAATQDALICSPAHGPPYPNGKARAQAPMKAASEVEAKAKKVTKAEAEVVAKAPAKAEAKEKFRTCAPPPLTWGKQRADLKAKTWNAEAADDEAKADTQKREAAEQAKQEKEARAAAAAEAKAAAKAKAKEIAEAESLLKAVMPYPFRLADPLKLQPAIEAAKKKAGVSEELVAKAEKKLQEALSDKATQRSTKMKANVEDKIKDAAEASPAPAPAVATATKRALERQVLAITAKAMQATEMVHRAGAEAKAEAEVKAKAEAAATCQDKAAHCLGSVVQKLQRCAQCPQTRLPEGPAPPHAPISPTSAANSASTRSSPRQATFMEDGRALFLSMEKAPKPGPEAPPSSITHEQPGWFPSLACFAVRRK